MGLKWHYCGKHCPDLIQTGDSQVGQLYQWPEFYMKTEKQHFLCFLGRVTRKCPLICLFLLRIIHQAILEFFVPCKFSASLKLLQNKMVKAGLFSWSSNSISKYLAQWNKIFKFPYKKMIHIKYHFNCLKTENNTCPKIEAYYIMSV